MAKLFVTLVKNGRYLVNLKHIAKSVVQKEQEIDMI
jgi:hypothetical protein